MSFLASRLDSQNLYQKIKEELSITAEDFKQSSQKMPRKKRQMPAISSNE